MKPSVLSASIVMGAVLQDQVGNLVSKIFPVIAVKDAEAPYICYSRIKLSQDPIKIGAGPKAAHIQVDCFTREYGEGVELAEAVNNALDGCQCKLGDISMRSCMLINAGEDYRDDTFVQTLLYQVKI